MAEITLNTEHLSQALARLAEQFKDKPNLAALIGIYVAKVQEVENVFWDIFVLRSIDSATGHQLDMLGSIVGQLRLGATDDVFRLYIKTRIKTNVSSGTAEELIDVFAPLVDNDGQVNFYDQPPAGFTLQLSDSPVTGAYASILLAFLRAAKAGGVRGILEYSPTTEALTFAFDGGNGLGFGDDSDPSVGGQLSSGVI